MCYAISDPDLAFESPSPMSPSLAGNFHYLLHLVRHLHLLTHPPCNVHCLHIAGGGQGRPGRNRAVDKKGGSARRHGGPPSACSRAIQLPTLTLHKIGCCRVVCTALRRAIWQLSCVRSSPQVRLARLEIKSKKQSLPSFHFGAGMRLLASVFVRLLSIL